MPEYLLEYNQIKNLTITELSDKLNDIRGLPLKNCKISDFIFYKGKPIYMGNGVYIFRNEERFIYVGKCSAQPFVQRVPSHFDIRMGGWFSGLLRNINKFHGRETSNEAMVEAAKEAFESQSVILINFPYDVDNKAFQKRIGRLEDMLRITLNPLNTFKTKRIGNRNVLVEDYVR